MFVAKVLFAVLTLALLAACGNTGDGTTGQPEAAEEASGAGLAPVWRYVNSGWVSPVDYQKFGAYSQELRAFVITNEAELDSFNRSVISKRTLGTGASLGRAEFPGSVLLAAYYIWRPVQGDPLSVTGFTLEGDRATVDLELDDDAQGRLYPYLFAPMTMVAVDRSLFPETMPVEFVFRVNGEPHLAVSTTPN